MEGAKEVEDTGIVVKTKLWVRGICCPAEVPIIHKLLQPLPGVKSIEVPYLPFYLWPRTPPPHLSPPLVCH